jgi:phage terminase large subunit-like protein
MVELTIQSAVERGEYLPVTLVTASRGKATRAEPISALYEKGLVHHVGAFEILEDQMCLWEPGQSSPDRMDALVWALTDLMLEPYDPDGGVH